MLLDDLLEPIELLLVDRDLVGCVPRCAEGRGSEADHENFLGDLVAKLWCLLAEDPQVCLQVRFVGVELVESFEVVVAAHYVELAIEAIEILAHELEAWRSPRKKLLRPCAVLGFSEVAERDKERPWRVLQCLLHVFPTLVSVFHVSRVDVEVTKDPQRERRRVTLGVLNLRGRRVQQAHLRGGNRDMRAGPTRPPADLAIAPAGKDQGRASGADDVADARAAGCGALGGGNGHNCVPTRSRK
mmetsp:Transcript_73691/g.204963  ORF Transcript_73691/g.204963 Transcript_73691/m.204963 type:complete len:243 (+) Transcript_73691:1190-1918(+)